MFSVNSYEDNTSSEGQGKFDILFDSASLPYYVLNTNEDLLTLVENKEVALSCFPNEIDSILKLLQVDYSGLFINENTELFGPSPAEHVVLCPERDNILKYTQWYINSIDTIVDKLSTSSYIVEVPILPIKYFYARLLPRLDPKSSFRVYKSSYFNPFIDCLYLQKVDKAESVQKINNYNMFLSMFKTLFDSYLYTYLIGMSKVAGYITRGNFYGQEMLKYKAIKSAYLQSIRSLSLTDTFRD